MPYNESWFFRKEKPTNIFVFEGPDNVGKSTLIRTVKERLTALGYEVTVIIEPGWLNRQLLLHAPITKGWDSIAKLALFAKDRAENMIAHFFHTQYLDSNKIYIYDRREISTWVYQMAVGGGAALLRENGIDPDEFFFGTHARIFAKIESHFIYLHASYETIVARSPQEELDNMESEGAPVIKARYDEYERLAQKAGDSWSVVDADASPESMATQACAIIKRKMEEYSD